MNEGPAGGRSGHFIKGGIHCIAWVEGVELVCKNSQFLFFKPHTLAANLVMRNYS